MKRNVIAKLIYNLSGIYFSKNKNKDALYRKTIFYTLKDLGGVYNKFLQILCLTKNFMNGWSGPKEFEVFNRVDKENINLSEIITNKDDFTYISKEPIATGSFAQVYKGTLKTGEDVILKVLRPSVYNNLGKDLKKLKRIINIFSFFMKNNLINIKDTFNEFSRVCLTETNYEREIANIEYFYKMYEKNDHIKIPQVYKNLSSKYIIVQEEIKGITLADVISAINHDEKVDEIAKKLTGSDLWKQLTLIGGELLRCAFLEDFIYGDAHPGNIILLPNNEVAFIDFGIIANSPISHKAFYEWTKSYYDILNGSTNFTNFVDTTCNCFCPDFINALEKCTNNTFANAIGNSMSNKLEQIKLKNASIIDLVKNGHIFILFTEFLDKNNLLNIDLDMRNYELLKALQAYICTIFTIDKRFSNNKFATIMKDAMDYAFKFTEKIPVTEDNFRKTRYSINEGFELLDSILSSMADNDEFLFNNIFKEMFL